MAFQPTNFLGAPKQNQTLMQDVMGKELDNAFKRVQNKYAEPETQARIGLHTAQASQAQQEAQFMNYLFGGGDETQDPSMDMTAAANGMMPRQGGGMSANQSGQGGSAMAGGVNLNDPNTKAMLRDAYIRYKTHAGQPHATSMGGGQIFLQDALNGNQTIQAGRTPGQEAFEKVSGEDFAKHVNTLGDQYQKAVSEGQKLEYVLDILERNPDLTGPLNQYGSTYFSDEEKQEIFGTLGTMSKSMVLEMRNMFGTQFTNKDLQFAESMKIDESTPQPVLKGRAKTLLAMDRLLEKGALSAHKYIKENPTADKFDVMKHVADQINFREEMSQIQREAKEREKARGKELYLDKYSNEDIAETARVLRRTPEQVKKILKEREEKAKREGNG